MTEYDPMSYADPAVDSYEPRASGNRVPTRKSQRPSSNFGWAAAALLFFWPLSFSAFAHAGNVHPLWTEGKYDAAKSESRSAKRLGQIALGIFLALMLLWIAAIVTMIISGASVFGDIVEESKDNAEITTSQSAPEESTTTKSTTQRVAPSTMRRNSPSYPVPAPRNGITIPTNAPSTPIPAPAPAPRR